MTVVRLALGGPKTVLRTSFQALESPPALLVAYPYLDLLDRHREHGMPLRNWSMDSGAFSVANSGQVIELSRYIDECAMRLESDSSLVEVFALDVINDADASLRNAEEMWRQGGIFSKGRAGGSLGQR